MTHRIAVVGGGPKALFALESLIAATSNSSVDIAVDVFDPQPPGHGAAYDPAQPEYLRLNVDAGIVSVWPLSRTDDRRPDFRVWAATFDPKYADAVFPPRAAVGRYLRWAFDQLTRQSAAVRISHVPATVDDLEPTPARGWTVLADRRHGPYDEVLIATGHARSWNGTLLDESIPVHRAFPVEQLGAVPRGSRVRVRGAALTFIDVALTLTEGRGGTFTTTADALLYHPSGNEPALTSPYSRSGLLLTPKPDVLRPLPDISHARQRLVSGTLDALETAVIDLAADVLSAAGVRPHRGELVAALNTDVDVDVVERLRHCVAVCCGSLPPGPEYALGRAWSLIYRDLVRRFCVPELPIGDRARFAELACTMERFAFGPPLLNARKLLALIESGIVDVDHLTGVATDGGPYDVLVDAVLPPPGWRHVTDPLVTALLARGLVTIADGARGINVDGTARVMGPDGATIGLSATGRPTEDSVIGNDTLNRAIHDHPQLWAERLLDTFEGRHD
ncbi:putative NAD(P)/FAD-binding protein YdhS [Rhodococcus sp. 27YEA15]|uniref:FAD/NAD(P)-binding protein n=1 Tax=Rhodococcus sp. 27YEA15 TaxID=3156259 RepID=UPI003C79B4C6